VCSVAAYFERGVDILPIGKNLAESLFDHDEASLVATPF
jgi:hypothetical protein